ncbi:MULTISPECIES: flavin reductase family protein [unclassified Streptomyces]|uniref:flavin reductase family protein n=1 Tax=unclassified Streptomyces TaxID=2593676 RepID=UPI002E8068D1|nr:flavin reductase family protein [Streptomyces sp. NBC_00589]WTI36547.1 flavin reductase family protein [Streptomyces sp. NBC_00775]WUB29777.1 flavin reductase family protein [Streptomyces sp. NBC_00589]
MTVEGAALRSALRAHASGVAVLTAAGTAGPAGVTITSFTSVSAEPALVSFCLAETSSTWARIRDCEWFGIQVLSAEQADVAERFAASGTDRFAAPTRWHTGPQGVPLLDDCLAWLVCSRRERLRLGDHHMVVAAVEHALAGAPGDALVHLRGAVRPVAAPRASLVP